MRDNCNFMNDFVSQVGLQKVATEHTRLIYMTTGVLLWKLVQTKCLTEYTHIFVDEVHKHAMMYAIKSIFNLFLIDNRINLYCIYLVSDIISCLWIICCVD